MSTVDDDSFHGSATPSRSSRRGRIIVLRIANPLSSPTESPLVPPAQNASEAAALESLDLLAAALSESEPGEVAQPSAAGPRVQTGIGARSASGGGVSVLGKCDIVVVELDGSSPPGGGVRVGFGSGWREGRWLSSVHYRVSPDCAVEAFQEACSYHIGGGLDS